MFRFREHPTSALQAGFQQAILVLASLHIVEGNTLEVCIDTYLAQ
jgi:hypothetical protein